MTTVEDLPRSCKEEVAQQCRNLYHEPQNFFILDLDERDADLRYNNKMRSIANHRFWTLWNSKKIYRYDTPPVLTSWQTPERGHYLQGIKIQGEIMFFIGNASKSWMYGVITKDYVGEFLDEEIIKTTQNGRSKKKQRKSMPPKQKKKTLAVVMQTERKHNIHALGWRRKDIPVTGNYGKLYDVDLGPMALENSCVNFLKFLKGNIEPSSSDLDKWATVIIVQCWDTSRNDEVMDSVLRAYHPSNSIKCLLKSESDQEMHDWQKIGIETDECINKKRNFRKIGFSRPTSVRQVFGLIRQLYGKVHDNNPFNANKNLPSLDPEDYDDQTSDEENEHDEHAGSNNDVNRLHFPDWIVMPQFQNVPFGNGNNGGQNNSGGEIDDNAMVICAQDLPEHYEFRFPQIKACPRDKIFGAQDQTEPYDFRFAQMKARPCNKRTQVSPEKVYPEVMNSKTYEENTELSFTVEQGNYSEQKSKSSKTGRAGVLFHDTQYYHELILGSIPRLIWSAGCIPEDSRHVQARSPQVQMEEQLLLSITEYNKQSHSLATLPSAQANRKIPDINYATVDSETLLERLGTLKLAARQIEDVHCQLKKGRKHWEGCVPLAYMVYMKKMERSGKCGDHRSLQVAADMHELTSAANAEVMVKT